jgi:hypothetical protein
MKRPTLTFFRANELCRKLVPIGDAIWRFAEQLRAEGYSAFDAYNDFVESFGVSDDIEVHRLCAVEQAKLRLCQPWPMKYSSDERKLLYSSNLLSELYARRDAENGCPASEIESKYPGVNAVWRREFDPCRRNMVRFEISQRTQYQLRFAKFVEWQRLMIEGEIRAHLSGDTNQAVFEMEDRFAKYQEVMDRVSIPLGFQYDKQKSRDEFPVFSKHLTDGWDLCWTLQHTDMFALTPKEGCFAPNLDLRGANMAGDADKARAQESLFFRYQHIVPGFGIAYWKFRNLAELEWAIRAHLCLYKMMSPILEASITSTSLVP